MLQAHFISAFYVILGRSAETPPVADEVRRWEEETRSSADAPRKAMRLCFWRVISEESFPAPSLRELSAQLTEGVLRSFTCVQDDIFISTLCRERSWPFRRKNIWHKKFVILSVAKNLLDFFFSFLRSFTYVQDDIIKTSFWKEVARHKPWRRIVWNISQPSVFALRQIQLPSKGAFVILSGSEESFQVLYSDFLRSFTCVQDDIFISTLCRERSWPFR